MRFRDRVMGRSRSIGNVYAPANWTLVQCLGGPNAPYSTQDRAERDHKVLDSIIAGKMTKQIAAELGVCERTVLASGLCWTC